MACYLSHMPPLSETSIVRRTETSVNDLFDLWKRRKAVCVIVFLVIVTPSAVLLWENFSNVPHLNAQIAALRADKQLLETQLTPFRTVALERFGGTEAEALSKLALQLNDIQAELSALQNYSETAKLNLYGLTGRVRPPLGETSLLSTLLQGCYTNVGAGIYPLCTPEAQAKFLTATRNNPDFPFPFCAIAWCHQAAGNPDWHDYAVKALAILDQTTSLKGHHPDHDSARESLKKMLDQHTTTHQ